MDRIAASDDAATGELVSAPVAERCANCQTPLASDQRYCVNCGERRGKARFSFETLTAPPSPPPAPEKRRRPNISSSVSFILGVATLLLAMGVGVLIGHNATPKTTTQAAAPSQTIKIIGGLGGGGNSSSGSAAASKKPAVKANAFQAPKVKLTPKVTKAVNNAANKVLGSNANKALPKNPTQQVGQSCSGGAGCQSGKYTGNYFGP